jgi:hypothetical protein
LEAKIAPPNDTINDEMKSEAIAKDGTMSVSETMRETIIPIIAATPKLCHVPLWRLRREKENQNQKSKSKSKKKTENIPKPHN